MKINRIVILVTAFVVLLFFAINLQIRQTIETKKNASVVTVGLNKSQMDSFRADIGDVNKYYSHIENGKMLMMEGRLDESVGEFKIAFELAKSKGGKGEANYCLANAYEKYKDYENALRYLIVSRDKYVNDWAKEPIIERVKYLEYVMQGNYELAIEYAQKAVEADKKLQDSPKGGDPEYSERLSDLIAAREYIKSLKK